MTTISDQILQKYSRIDEEDTDVSHSDDPEDEDHDEHASVFRGTSSWEKHESDHSPAKDSLRSNNSLHRETNQHFDHRVTSSFEMDDDDWDEDEAALRRYNLDVKTIPTNFRPPEFETFPKRLSDDADEDLQFLNLRTAARQRQAARLLNMPSETFFYKCHSFCMTICDATDQGIMLVAACMALWLLIGLVAPVSPFYWMTGIGIFIVRVSARRIVEYLQGNRLRHRRLRLSSIELGGDASYRNTATKETTAEQDIV